MSTRHPVALLSVFNKDGIVEFATELAALGFEIYASGGTRLALIQGGVEANDVAWLVGGAAILGHRVVTLSREIHAGLLADPNNPEHVTEMAGFNIPFIDLVYNNCYPLKAAIAAGKSAAQVLEATDIGGPCMLRSAAKGRRIVMCDPADQPRVLAWLKEDRPDADAFLTGLAAKAEGYVADYALASARYTSGGAIDGMIGTKVWDLCYGENKETPAGLYALEDDPDPLAVHRFVQVGGNAPSSINVTDLDRGLNTMTRFTAGWKLNFGEMPLVGLALKHGKCCGAAYGKTPLEVIRNLIDCDPLSIFGGTLMFNFRLDTAAARELRNYRRGEIMNGYDVIIAPGYDEGASEVLERKSGKTRVYENPALATELIAELPPSMTFRPVRGGFIRMPASTFLLQVNDPRMEKHVPEGAEPVTEQQLKDLILAFAVCATSESNTTTIVVDGMLLANGVGQQSRVDVCELAVSRAIKRGHGDKLPRAVAVTDSFFPFPDALEVLVNAGIRFIWSTSPPKTKPEVIAVGMKAGAIHWTLSDAFARLFFGHFGR